MQPNEQQSNDPTNSTPPESVTQPVSPESAPVPEQSVEAPVVSVGLPAQPTAEPAGIVAAQPMGMPPQASPSKGLPKKAKLAALIVGGIVLLGGASAGAYFGVVVPNQPQKVVADSLSNTLNEEKVSSAKFEGEVNCVSGDACKAFSGVTFKGAFDDKANLDANIQVKTLVTTVGLDIRALDKTAYLRLSGLNGLDKLLGQYGGSEAASYATMFAAINNQWFSIDESMLKQFGGEAFSGTTEPTLSKADAKKIGDAYKKNQFITINQKLADEKIHDVPSYHIQATIDKTKLKGFLGEVKQANIKDLKIEQSDIDGVDKVDFSKYPFDVWVTKKGRMITQFAMNFEEQKTKGKVRVAFYDYNKAVKVEKPAGAKSILELMSQIAPAYSGVQGANSDNPLSLLGL